MLGVLCSLANTTIKTLFGRDQSVEGFLFGFTSISSCFRKKPNSQKSISQMRTDRRAAKLADRRAELGSASPKPPYAGTAQLPYENWPPHLQSSFAHPPRRTGLPPTNLFPPNID
jgi:hypothetical protein